MITSSIVLWVYIVLLVIGGLIGFFKAKSTISLVTSLIFALLLIICAIHPIPIGGVQVADLLLLILLIVFGIRFIKKKKFMPSGLMTVVTLLALALHQILK